MSQKAKTDVDLFIEVIFGRCVQPTRDLKFGIQIGSDWPQMGQIWDFHDKMILKSMRVNNMHFL